MGDSDGGRDDGGTGGRKTKILDKGITSKMANRDPHRSSKVHSTFSCRFLGTARGLSVSKSFVALLGAGDGDGSGGRNDGGGRGGCKWGPLGTARGLSAFNSSVALLGAGDGGRNASSKWNSAALGAGGRSSNSKSAGSTENSAAVGVGGGGRNDGGVENGQQRSSQVI